MIVNRHVSKGQVEAYYSGRLFQPQLAIVEEHLEHCDHCLTRLGVIVLRHSLGRNRSEREVEKSLISLAANVESSDNAIIGANPDGTVVSWNLGTELSFGCTRQETIGEKVEILGPRGPRNDSSKILTAFRIGRAAPPFVSVSHRK